MPASALTVAFSAGTIGLNIYALTRQPPSTRMEEPEDDSTGPPPSRAPPAREEDLSTPQLSEGAPFHFFPFLLKDRAGGLGGGGSLLFRW
jgi:hypothetical protein